MPVWISLKTATVATFITFFLGIVTAWWMLGYRGKGKAIIESVLTAPLVLPPTVVGFFLLLILGKNGFLGQILGFLGIRVIFTWYATAIAATVVSFPLMYKTALSAFKQINPDFIACAKTLGASEWTIFWRIIIPLSKQGLLAGTLLAFARSLGEFGATLMVAGSIPGKTETIPIAIYFAAESGAMDRAFFLVLIMLAISFGVIYGLEMSQERFLSHAKSYAKRYPLGQRRKGKQSVSFKDFCQWRQKWAHLTGYKSFKFSQQQEKVRLIVEIQKTLSDFVLDVAFDCDSEPLGILGASGAGKSTILRCIAGLETPDKGRIIFNNRVLFDSEKGINLPSRERNCGFLFQNYALFPHLTVEENIAFGIKFPKSYRDVKKTVESSLCDLELTEMGDRFSQELSGGEQQRVALARARASNPDIFLLDEPFSALDTYLRHKQQKLLRKSLQKHSGVTIFITHNLEEAYRVCPNLLIIDRGKTIAYGTKQDIFNHSRNFRVAQLTGCKNFSRSVAINPNQVRATDWNCILEVTETIPESFAYIGIRAHQIIFPKDNSQPNTFPCWLASISETQHRVTLYLKLHQPPQNNEDYQLQAEIFKDKWHELKNDAFPWNIQLHPDRIMLLNAKINIE